MGNKTLQVIESAYRAVAEEQDDTVVWVTHAMKGAGGEFGILLRANAVNYAVNAQETPALQFGEWKQTQPPRVSQDVASLMTKGCDVFVVEEDLAERGIERTDLIQNVKFVNRAGVAKLFNDYDRVWYW
jgi:sulfur relay (sulfurtransferase) DsrF/TusC family protein